MLFSSITFLFVFLPLVLLGYYLMPMKAKNLWLLAASLSFYFYGEPKYLLLMLAQILSCYIFGLLTERSQGVKRKIAAFIPVAISLSSLIFFKYTDFIITSVNGVFGASINALGLALPIGISFYTFQAISYNVDVYRGDTQAQRNPFSLALYISLFPQLIAGPIVRYSDIERDLRTRRHDLDAFAQGAKRFAAGLAKKVLLANSFGSLCQIFRDSDEKSTLFFWIYAVAFSLQIYFDFSGYSDMAIGMGRMFGFRFPENFNYPYISKSVTEFWRRWHISLGSWFRDYVYIPMGGSRVSKARLMLNIATVWLLTGLWHGADWNFLLWGAYFGALLLIEKSIPKKIRDKAPAAIGHIYLLLTVIIGFVIFNASGLEGVAADLGGIFGASRSFCTPSTLYYLRSYIVLIIVGIIGATPLPKKLAERIGNTNAGKKLYTVAEPLYILAMLTAAAAYLVDGSYNPFLYFRF